MINVTRLVKTCDACPAQWEGKTDDNRPVYVRYRWGCLWIHVGEPGQGVDDAIMTGETIFAESLGDPFAGCMTLDELRAATRDIIQLPDGYDDTAKFVFHPIDL